MKAYILLGLNSEYHGYDIFFGAFSSEEKAIERVNGWFGGKYYICTHKHDHKLQQFDKDDDLPTHTHIVVTRKPWDEERLAKEIYNDNEDDGGGDVINCFVIETHEI